VAQDRVQDKKRERWEKRKRYVNYPRPLQGLVATIKKGGEERKKCQKKHRWSYIKMRDTKGPTKTIRVKHETAKIRHGGGRGGVFGGGGKGGGFWFLWMNPLARRKGVHETWRDRTSDRAETTKKEVINEKNRGSGCGKEDIS